MDSKIQAQPLIVILALSLFAWVDCANTPSCANMTSWFPGTSPASFADDLPYQLSVSGYVRRGGSVPVYSPESSHTVYLNGSMTNSTMRNFLGFIVYAENSVTRYPNGRFVAGDLPPGVEEVNCSTLYIVQNSTSDGNWTSVKLLWKAPKDGHFTGNITFRASVLEKTNPLTYYEGFRAHLRYDCPMRKCVACPSGSYYMHDSYGCQTCQCGGICANTTCPFYGICHPSVDQKTAECKCDIICTEEYRPVCGTDGKTHSNECKMKTNACNAKMDITVAYMGECSAAESLRSTFQGISLMVAFLLFLWFSA